MAKASNLSHFTALRESGGGHLRSTPAGNGRRLYKDVTIIKAGLGNQRDRNYYPPAMLEANVSKFDGLRAYADHPSSLDEEVQPERTVRDMVGVYRRPRFVREGKEGGRVVADLNLFRSAKWLSDTVDDLIDLGQADKIGLSINGRGKTTERQLQLEEAADPINVNWVEDFLVLRSADVVTEAGAGGGFPQLLESARGSSTEETAMKRLNESQQRAIKAAIDANDMEKVTALLAECGVEMPAAAAKGKAKAAKKPAATEAQEADDDPEDDPEDDTDVDGDDTEGDDTEESEDPDAALDAEAERIKAEAGDPDEDETQEADADETEEDEAQESEVPKGAGKLLSGGGAKHKLKGATETAGKSGNAVAKKAVGPRSPQKGRRYAESDAPVSRREFEQLQRQNIELAEKNATLSAQIRVRSTTDRARNLLRESKIPEALRPDLLPLLVGKREEEQRRIIRYHQRVIETAVAEAGSEVTDSGTRFRESHHGAGGAEDYGSDVLDGLPLKE